MKSNISYLFRLFHFLIGLNLSVALADEPTRGSENLKTCFIKSQTCYGMKAYALFLPSILLGRGNTVKTCYEPMLGEQSLSDENIYPVAYMAIKKAVREGQCKFDPIIH